MNRDEVISKIIVGLVDDIGDRSGIGDQLQSIDDEILTQEIYPAWREIIGRELDKLERKV